MDTGACALAPRLVSQGWGIIAGMSMDGMDSLFAEVDRETRFNAAPLAVRMRPRTMNEVVGQEEAVGKGTCQVTATVDGVTLKCIVRCSW